MTDWAAKQMGEAIAEKEKAETKKKLNQSMDVAQEEAKNVKLTRLIEQFNSPIQLLCLGFMYLRQWNSNCTTQRIAQTAQWWSIIKQRNNHADAVRSAKWGVLQSVIAVGRKSTAQPPKRGGCQGVPMERTSSNVNASVDVFDIEAGTAIDALAVNAQEVSLVLGTLSRKPHGCGPNVHVAMPMTDVHVAIPMTNVHLANS